MGQIEESEKNISEIAKEVQEKSDSLQKENEILKREVKSLQNLIISQAKSLETEKEIKLLGNNIRNFIILKDGRIAVGSKDNTIEILDPENKKVDLTIKDVHSKGEGISSLDLLTNGDIISGSYETELRIIRLLPNSQYKIICTNSKAHDKMINRVLGLPKNRLVSSSDDNFLKVWNDKLELTATIQNYNSGLSLLLLKNGLLVSGCYAEKNLTFINLDTSTCVKKIEDIKSCSGSDSLLEIDNNRLLVGELNELVIVNIENYEIIKKVKFPFSMLTIIYLGNDTLLTGGGKGGSCDIIISDLDANARLSFTQTYEGTGITEIRVINSKLFASLNDGTFLIIRPILN